MNINKTKIIIFQKGGHAHTNKYSPFKYGEAEIEIVKQYTYLGVIFSNSATFLNNVNSVYSKSNRAVSATIALIRSLNPDSWPVINKLFESLVASVVMYGAQIWSLRYLDQIEKIQLSYFKKILLLPRNTPNYAIRLETGRLTLAVRVFTQILNWIGKLYEMSDERIPKICFNRLKELAVTSTLPDKYNWCLQVKQFFTDAGLLNIWDSLSLSTLQENRTTLIANYKRFLYEKDYQRVSLSSTLDILPQLNLSQGPQKYFAIRLPPSIRAMIAQIRLFNNVSPRLIINTKMYILNNKSICTRCDMGSLDELYHVLVECPAFECERSEFLRHANCQEQASDFRKNKFGKIS